MLKQISLLLILTLCFEGLVFAQGQTSVEDKIIGSIFKVLAKTFVAVGDINKIKKDNIEVLSKMKEEKFNKRYAQVYNDIKDLPIELKVRYGIGEAMTKKQAIRNIEALDRQTIYEGIDSIPDTFIAHQFKQYLSEKKEEIQKSYVVEQINKFWKNIIEKVNPTPLPKEASPE